MAKAQQNDDQTHQDTMDMSKLVFVQQELNIPTTLHQTLAQSQKWSCSKGYQVMSAIIWQIQFHKGSPSHRIFIGCFFGDRGRNQRNPLHPRGREYWSSCTPARCLSSNYVTSGWSHEHRTNSLEPINIEINTSVHLLHVYIYIIFIYIYMNYHIYIYISYIYTHMSYIYIIYIYIYILHPYV